MKEIKGKEATKIPKARTSAGKSEDEDEAKDEDEDKDGK